MAGFFSASAFPKARCGSSTTTGWCGASAGERRAIFSRRWPPISTSRRRQRRSRPERPLQFGLYLAGKWHRLALKTAPAADGDPTATLDAELLTKKVLAPLLGIEDLRNDPGIDFVGGSRGLDGLAARVDSGGMAAAFALYPVTLRQLFAVADADRVMPPKSTWFEPKLADGLLSLPLDG